MNLSIHVEAKVNWVAEVRLKNLLEMLPQVTSEQLMRMVQARGSVGGWRAGEEVERPPKQKHVRMPSMCHVFSRSWMLSKLLSCAALCNPKITRGSV